MDIVDLLDFAMLPTRWPIYRDKQTDRDIERLLMQISSKAAIEGARFTYRDQNSLIRDTTVKLLPPLFRSIVAGQSSL